MGNIAVSDDLNRTFIGFHQFGSNLIPGMVMQRVVDTGDGFDVSGNGPQVVRYQQYRNLFVQFAQFFVQLFFETVVNVCIGLV